MKGCSSGLAVSVLSLESADVKHEGVQGGTYSRWWECSPSLSCCFILSPSPFAHTLSFFSKPRTPALPLPSQHLLPGSEPCAYNQTEGSRTERDSTCEKTGPHCVFSCVTSALRSQETEVYTKESLVLTGILTTSWAILTKSSRCAGTSGFYLSHEPIRSQPRCSVALIVHDLLTHPWHFTFLPHSLVSSHFDPSSTMWLRLGVTHGPSRTKHFAKVDSGEEPLPAAAISCCLLVPISNSSSICRTFLE